jgi:hypothetical protein
VITLYVECRESDTARLLSLPVEVRRPDGVLVTRALAPFVTYLPAGLYYVLSRFPGGEEWYASISRADDKLRHDVVLTGPRPQPVAVRPAPVADPRKGLTPEFDLRWFDGDPLLGKCRTANAPGGGWRDDVVEVDPLKEEAAPSLAQLVQEGRPPLNVALPVVGKKPFTLLTVRLPNGQRSLEVVWAGEDVQRLLAYLDHGMLAEAALLVQAPELALQAPGRDPVTAALVAYVLLRLDKVDSFAGWATGADASAFPLADGSVLRGEYLARTGRHAEALEAFLQLSARGLPLFADGLSLALDRLRTYDRAFKVALAPDRRKAAGELLARLQPFGTFADFDSPLLTFTGSHPNQPDATPLLPNWRPPVVQLWSQLAERFQRDWEYVFGQVHDYATAQFALALGDHPAGLVPAGIYLTELTGNADPVAWAVEHDFPGEPPLFLHALDDVGDDWVKTGAVYLDKRRIVIDPGKLPEGGTHRGFLVTDRTDLVFTVDRAEVFFVRRPAATVAAALPAAELAKHGYYAEAWQRAAGEFTDDTERRAFVLTYVLIGMAQALAAFPTPHSDRVPGLSRDFAELTRERLKHRMRFFVDQLNREDQAP